MDYFYVLDYIIKEEVDKGRDIAIYPYGKVGMLAEYIVNKRYGKEVLLIDNKMAKYNDAIVTADEFVGLDNRNISVILCATNWDLNRELHLELVKKNNALKIRNIFEIRFAHEREAYFSEIKDLCKVKKANREMVRIGAKHDGGYVMLDDFLQGDIAYSFGIDRDISWDEHALSKGASVFCYDPTIDKLPKDGTGLFFEKIGITGKDNEEERLYSMQTILEKNGHMGKKNMILKMDVEGAEWDFLEETPSEILAQFKQMTFELHDFTLIENRERVLRVLSKIRKTHEPVWVHANNNGLSIVAGECRLPRLLEITYVNKENYNLVDTAYNCPSKLDAPNVLQFAEIELINWGSVENE